MVDLIGDTIGGFEFANKIDGKIFYQIKIAVKRQSGKYDILTLLTEKQVLGRIKVTGELRSRQYHNTLRLYVYAKKIEKTNECHYNDVFIKGVVEKEPIYRMTPKGREITDILLKTDRGNVSDHIPCIIWGKTHLKKGSRVRLGGRLQSREYTKKYTDRTETKTAYELSVRAYEIY